MAQPGRDKITFLDSPMFDLNWLIFPGGESFALLAGGGGGTKSGIRNQIQIVREDPQRALRLEVIDYVETDTADKSCLCSALAVGEINDSVVVAAALGGICRIYKVTNGHDVPVEEGKAGDKDSKKKGPPKGRSGIKFERVLEFQADFFKSEEDGPSINCMAFLFGTHIVTGGDDGVCRIWNIDTPSDTSNTSNREFPWEATLEVELKKHTGPVMAFSLHPEGSLLCSASKDGTCILWSLQLWTIVVEIPRIDGLSGMGSIATPVKGKDGKPVAPTIECRGCCFSQDGNRLFTIQSGRRGSVTSLIRWTFKQVDNVDNISDGDETKASIALEAVPSKVVVVAKVPSTKLRLSDDGKYIAVGTSSGEVVVLDSESMNKLKVMQCHDLPVTGLGFAPYPIIHGSGYTAVLTSCSADNKMITIPIGGYSLFFIVFYVLLSASFVFVLVYFSYHLFSLYVVH